MVPIATFVCEIDLATGRQLSPSQLLRYSRAGSGVCEGPHFFRKDDYLYLSTAEGGTEIGHQQWICRTKAGPMGGEWEEGPEGDINPLIYNGNHAEVRQTGHMDIVEGRDGQWWAVFLAVRPVYEDDTALLSPLGRETFLATVEWTDAGWPIVNKRQPIAVAGMSGPDLYTMPAEFAHRFEFKEGRGESGLYLSQFCDLDLTSSVLHEHFLAEDLYLDGWYHLRTPLKLEQDAVSRPGCLTLWGGPYTLEVDECPSMLLQKQPDFHCSWSFALDFASANPGSCAGTTVWWSRYAYAAAFIRCRENNSSRELVFRFPDLESDKFRVSGCLTLYASIEPIGKRLIWLLL